MLTITETDLQNFRNYLAELERSDATISKYIHDARALMEFAPEGIDGQAQLCGFRPWLEAKDLCASSINSMFGAVNQFLAFLGSNLRLRYIKVQRQTFIPADRELTRKEYEKLVQAAKEKETGSINMLIVDMVLPLLSYFAQKEREMIHQRQQEGIEAAKARGVKFGRQRRDLPPEAEEVYKSWKSGQISAEAAAKRLGMSRTTFYRRLGEMTSIFQAEEVSISTQTEDISDNISNYSTICENDAESGANEPEETDSATETDNQDADKEAESENQTNKDTEYDPQKATIKESDYFAISYDMNQRRIDSSRTAATINCIDESPPDT